jgi:sulfoxide reductase catalytic subunit YedY
LFLAVTGILLYLPGLRGTLAPYRVSLKQFHIFLGVLSVILLLLYIPLIVKHVRQISSKRKQIFNLWIVLMLLIGWSISGIILWQERYLPQHWGDVALIWHDLLTWIGIPYALYHSISRSLWLRRGPMEKITSIEGLGNAEDSSKASQLIKRLRGSMYPRRTFLRWVTGSFLVIAIGPPLYRWLKGVFDTGGSSLTEIVKNDGNQMLPEPTPLPESLPPIGGGAKGDFRIYSVTDLPSFSTETWEFAIGGLVATPFTWGWKEFLELPRRVQVSDFHCVTGWSVYSVTWEGIPLAQLLDLAGAQKNAKYVKLYSGDGVYTDSLALNQARMEDVVVAVLMDGKPIPQQLGGPVRLVVPKMFAYKSVKWLQAIELTEEEHLGVLGGQRI